MTPDKILPPPVAMQFMPKDHRGYVVPFFVEWINGKPDFRVIDGRKMRRCVLENLCWLCGGPLARTVAYVIGPMCAINRVSSEPPSHVECGEYACRVCPFLTMPKALRREAGLPAEMLQPAGVGLSRNPGVTLLWTTRDRLRKIQVRPEPGDRAIRGGVLFFVGNPIEVRWFSQGREASRAEVLDSIESGLPSLREPAQAQGPEAVAALERMHAQAMELLPA